MLCNIDPRCQVKIVFYKKNLCKSSKKTAWKKLFCYLRSLRFAGLQLQRHVPSRHQLNINNGGRRITSNNDHGNNNNSSNNNHNAIDRTNCQWSSRQRWFGCYGASSVNRKSEKFSELGVIFKKTLNISFRDVRMLKKLLRNVFLDSV